jgi:hypothetical protein
LLGRRFHIRNRRLEDEVFIQPPVQPLKNEYKCQHRIHAFSELVSDLAESLFSRWQMLDQRTATANAPSPTLRCTQKKGPHQTWGSKTDKHQNTYNDSPRGQSREY